MSTLPGILIGPVTDTQPFLDTYKPSSNDPSHGPWYWCQIPGAPKPAEHEEESLKFALFESEGQELVEALNVECERIKAEEPVRANKKLGKKSQKELRELEHSSFNSHVATLAKKHNVLSGKWLFYPQSDKVDLYWSLIVNALAKPDGALAKTGVCHTAKVSSTTVGESPYVICVYADDSWDKDGVGKLFETLIKDLGLVSSAYKCDANTLLGIDSKHPSGIKSSLYGKTDFMTKESIDEIIKKRIEETTNKSTVVKKPTKEEEVDDFDPVSDSEEEKEPPLKKKKV